MPSHKSRLITVRLDSVVLDVLAADFARQGYESLGSYLRAIIEQSAANYGILLELSKPALGALGKRQKQKGYVTIKAYLTAMLESYALGGDIAKEAPARPRRVK